MNAGYFIDNQGREMEYELSSSVESDEDLLKELLKKPTTPKQQRLHKRRFKEGKQLFSEREIVKLYDWLYKIDAACEIERTQDHPVAARYKILGVRYKEDGTTEIITIFEAGECYGNNPDPYAQKVRKAVLKKKPIKIMSGICYTK